MTPPYSWHIPFFSWPLKNSCKQSWLLCIWYLELYFQIFYYEPPPPINTFYLHQSIHSKKNSPNQYLLKNKDPPINTSDRRESVVTLWWIYWYHAHDMHIDQEHSSGGRNPVEWGLVIVQKRVPQFHLSKSFLTSRRTPIQVYIHQYLLSLGLEKVSRKQGS